MEVSNLPEWIDLFDKLKQLFWGYFINMDLTTYVQYATDYYF